jgi:hypothetical protein
MENLELAVAIERIRSGVQLSSAHYPTFYSILHEMFCNLSRCFPLYGVEASGLPLRVARSGKESHMLRSLAKALNKPGMWITKERTEYEDLRP